MKYLEVLIYETERKERACGQRSNSQRYKDRVRTGWYHGNQVREKGAQRKHHCDLQGCNFNRVGGGDGGGSDERRRKEGARWEACVLSGGGPQVPCLGKFNSE